MSQQSNQKSDVLVVMELANKFGALADGIDHRLVLNALLLSYIAGAKTHSCCTQAAINALLDAAEEISGVEMPGTDVQSLPTETIVLH